MQHMSQLAEDRLTKPWEECVLYPYDDKVPKRRGPDGKLAYPEYTGGPVRGTITQGFGHTDAAGAPKIVLNAPHWTEEYATQVLADDMAPCCDAVNRLVKVPLGQHRADCLDDFVFNCGAGTLQKSTLLKKLNAGDYDAVPAELMKFTLSRGEHMEGLVHRRQAEISMWNMADEATDAQKLSTPISPVDHGISAEEVFCPKGELPPARSALDSKTIMSGTATGFTGIAMLSKGADQLNQAAEPIKQVQDNLQQIGLWDHLVGLANSQPLLIGGGVVLALGIFMAWDRWRHLQQEAH